MKQANSKRLEKLLSDIEKIKSILRWGLYKELHDLQARIDAEEFEELKKVRSLYEEIESIKEEEESIFDDRSDRWKEGEKGEEARIQIEALESLMNNLETIDDSLQETNLNSIIEEIDSKIESLSEAHSAIEEILSNS